MTKAQNQLIAWGRGIEYEIGFWREFFATQGNLWPEEYLARLNPDTPIDPFYIQHLRGVDLRSARILDVGAGPLTKLGKVHEGVRLNITACDPLADHYSDILNAHGISAPIKTVKAFAEDLSSYFDEDHFDLVTCTNALDHSFEPLRGTIQMLDVVKIGGKVLLQHAFNEAENENYSGFHQWNFDLINGRFIMWNRENRIDVAENLSGFADVSVENRGYLTAVITKTAPVLAPSFTDRRERIRTLLDASVTLSHFIIQEQTKKASIDRFPPPPDDRNSVEQVAATAAGERISRKNLLSLKSIARFLRELRVRRPR